MEALKTTGLEWNVEQWPLHATNSESRLMIDDQRNVRMPSTSTPQ
jgi:thiamine pyrophosphokinase